MDHHIILLHIVHSYLLHQILAEVHRHHSQILQVVGHICIQPFQVLQALQVHQVIQAMEIDTQTHTAVETETQAHQIRMIHTTEIGIEILMVIATVILTAEEIHMTTEIKAHHLGDLRLVTFSTFCVGAAVAAAAVAIVMEAVV